MPILLRHHPSTAQTRTSLSASTREHRSTRTSLSASTREPRTSLSASTREPRTSLFASTREQGHDATFCEYARLEQRERERLLHHDAERVRDEPTPRRHQHPGPIQRKDTSLHAGGRPDRPEHLTHHGSTAHPAAPPSSGSRYPTTSSTAFTTRTNPAR